MPEREQPNISRRKLLVKAVAVADILIGATFLAGQLRSDSGRVETEEERKLTMAMKAVQESDDRVEADSNKANVQKRADVVIELLPLLSSESAVSFFENEREIRQKIPDNLHELVEHPVQLRGKANEMSPQGGLIFFDDQGKYSAILNRSAIGSQGKVVELTGWAIKTGLYVLTTDETP